MDFGVSRERNCALATPKRELVGSATLWSRSRCSRGAASLYSARTSCSHHLWGPSAQRMSRGGILHALV
jgi:hypothetical protein